MIVPQIQDISENTAKYKNIKQYKNTQTCKVVLFAALGVGSATWLRLSGKMRPLIKSYLYLQVLEKDLYSSSL